jgi:hypothetical protein
MELVAIAVMGAVENSRESCRRTTSGCSSHEGFRPRTASMASSWVPLSLDRLALAAARALTLASRRGATTARVFLFR